MFLTSLQVGIPPGRSEWSQSPQSRVNVSYVVESFEEKYWISESQSPQSRVNVSYFLEKDVRHVAPWRAGVAIPSNRVNVSYIAKPNNSYCALWASQSPQIGSIFLTLKPLGKIVIKPNRSQSPQIGSIFLTLLFGQTV